VFQTVVQDHGHENAYPGLDLVCIVRISEDAIRRRPPYRRANAALDDLEGLELVEVQMEWW